MRPGIPPRRSQKSGHVVMQSCQHAIPLGKFAGYNAAADLLGLPQAPFAPIPYATCLDLGAAGAVATSGWDREVQMTGTEAKALKQQINAEWIYPPLDDADAILKFADYQQTWPPAEIFDQPAPAAQGDNHESADSTRSTLVSRSTPAKRITDRRDYTARSHCQTRSADQQRRANGQRCLTPCAFE